MKEILKDVSYIIGYRQASEDRRLGLQFVLNWLYKFLPEMEILLIEQDAKSNTDLKLPPNCKKHFIYNPGLYNRCWAFNVGVNLTDKKILAFADSDLFLLKDDYISAFEACRSFQAVTPNSRTLYNVVNANVDLLTYEFSEKRRLSTFAGGLLIMQRDAYNLIGGWDERFEGWGGEDDAISHLIYNSLASKTFDLKMYHVDHARSVFDGKTQPGYLYNRLLYEEITTLSGPSLSRYLNRQKENITGDPDKYKNVTEPLKSTGLHFVLAVTTYNRKKYIDEFLLSWEKTRSKEVKWTVIIADDGSVDGTLDYLDHIQFEDVGIFILKNKRLGIAGQTNTIIDRLMSMEFDVCFCCNDDILFTREGWEFLYWEVLKRTGYHHLCYFDSAWKLKNNLPEPLVRGQLCNPCLPENIQGCFFTLTPEVVRSIGYFDTVNFGFRGLAHVDYTWRCCRGGYNVLETPFDVLNSNDYIQTQKDNYILSIPGPIQSIMNNEPEKRRKWKIIRRNRIFIPKAEINNFPEILEKHEKGEDPELLISLSQNVGDTSAVKESNVINRFLKNTFPPYTIKWFLQRTIVVVKESRLPQFAFLAALTKKDKNKFSTPNTRFEVKIPELQKQSNLINNYFDCIYLLNLKNRPGKRLKSIFQLKQMGISAMIVDGVDGYQHPHKKEYDRYLKIPLYAKDAHPLEFIVKRKCISSPGAWGVLKSKKIILRDAIKNNYQRILILQDDLFFINDFHKRFADFIREIDVDWKIISLGATQHKWIIPEYLSYRDPAITEYDPDQKFYFPLVTDGAFALGCDRSIFQTLIDEIDRMNCSFDSGPVRSVYKNYFTKCFVCQPNLVIADVSTSDIREGRNQEEFSAKMKWDLNLYDRKKYSELVSVIMPAYNAEKTIEKSIRSVIMQTYENLELIIVDDGSTDNTEAIARKLAAEDKRIIYKRNEQNRGCYFVRNDALRLSRGKYIAIQDADDISLKTRIEKQLIPLVSGNAFVSFCLFLRSRCSVEELDLYNQDAMMDLVMSRRIKVYRNYQYQDRPNLALATSVYNRELFKKYGLFWESRFGSDGEFIERIFFHELGISFHNEPVNAHTFITRARARQNAFFLLDELLYISPEMEESNLSVKYKIKGQERTTFIENYRKRLVGKYEYQYPVF